METKDTAGIIEKLEAASGPDRAIDFRIQALLDGEEYVCEIVSRFMADEVSDLPDRVFGYRTKVGTESRDYTDRYANRYTSSIDAALSLVPPNTYYMLGYGKTREPEPLGACAFFRPGEDEPFVQAEAPTIALALCLTALRARAQGE